MGTDDPKGAAARAALESLCRSNERDLYTYALRLLRGRVAEALDAVQSTFLTAWRKWDPNRPPHTLRAWLFGIAGRECGMSLRRLLRRRPEPLSDYPSRSSGPSTTLARREEDSRLLAAVDRLPGEEREVLLLHIAGLRVAEIAEAIGKPPQTAYNRLNRGTDRLRQLLAQAS